MHKYNEIKDIKLNIIEERCPQQSPENIPSISQRELKNEENMYIIIII